MKPDWNLHNTYNNPEHKLFDSLTTEFNSITGFPVYYYRLIDTGDADSLYGEYPNSKFSEPYSTKVVYTPSYEENLLDVFGFVGNDTLEFMYITKTLFSIDVSSTEKPKPGDVIKALWNNKTYEITKVGSEQKIFQGKKMIWEFICKPYVHSEESDSADDMLNKVLTDVEFPEINITTETEELSAYGDNDDITDEASNISNDIDSAVYGY